MSFFKRSVDKLSKIYGDTIPSIFSIALLFLIIFALSMINEITSYISLGLLLFLFFPLLLSAQIFVSRIFSYKTDLNYKDIYKQMRLYYTPIFKGVFSVFSAFIFTPATPINSPFTEYTGFVIQIISSLPKGSL